MEVKRRFGCPMRNAALLGLLFLLAIPCLTFGSDDVVRFGLIADTHAHDLDSPLEGKWMSNTEERLTAFTTAMNEWEPDFVI